MTTLTQFTFGLTIAALTMLFTVFTHYEGLRFITKYTLKRPKNQHRRQLLVIMLAITVLHCIEIWMYAAAIALTEKLGMGSLYFMPNIAQEGAYGVHYVYYASAIYTSLGFGDISPEGALRILSGAAGLNGLLLIAWSASFTYLSMEKFWQKD